MSDADRWHAPPPPSAEAGPVVLRLTELPDDRLAELVADSERQGYRFVRRLVDEWASGANRFDRPGEALFGALCGGRVVGVCGLNVDPYAGSSEFGRVRHLYVLAAHRRIGVGRCLVQEVLRAARGVFARLRLRTADARAAWFYERLGFRAVLTEADSTHILELAPGEGRQPSRGIG
jgi:GNAT superfamily N-acetyltransferase